MTAAKVALPYSEYWQTVIGARTALQTCREFELTPGPRAGFDEWLGHAEEAAIGQALRGFDPTHAETKALRAEMVGFFEVHHSQAVDELEDAASQLHLETE